MERKWSADQSVHQREVLKDCGNQLRIYEDRPYKFDAWDIDLFYTQKEPELPTLTACTLREIGPLCCAVRFEYLYHRSAIKQDMAVYAESRRVDFVTTVDRHEPYRMLKAAFPVDIRSTRATFDIQCGHVERPTHYNTSRDYARFEVCAHKWADLSDDSFGVSRLNDCKYGYNVHGNEMQITLLKSAKEPDYAADMGEHCFTYSVLSHAGAVTQGNTIPESHFLNRPVTMAAGRTEDCPLLEFEGEHCN